MRDFLNLTLTARRFSNITGTDKIKIEYINNIRIEIMLIVKTKIKCTQNLRW